MKISSTSMLVLLILPLLCLAADTEIPRVSNDIGPSSGIEPLVLNELWRAGGEDEEVIFGRIVDVTMGDNGDVYVLDNQLCQVVVFSNEGEHLRDLSREGDGPGELRQPVGIVRLTDDVLGIGVGFPGKVVTLDLEGTPITSIYPIGEPADGNLGLMMGVQFVNGVLVACGGRVDIGGTEEPHTDRFLSVTDAECSKIHHVLEKATPLDMTVQRFVEASDYYVQRRWALGPRGRIYAATERDAYEISVFDTTGELLRIFGRRYEARRRTQADKDEIRPVIIMGGNPEIVAEDHDECISRVMFNHDEDTLWVLTPHGDNDQPDGILQTWDVFGTDGEYLRQVPIPLGDEMNDGTCYLVGGSRLVVVKGTASVFGGNRNTGEDLAETVVEPLEVICYEVR